MSERLREQEGKTIGQVASELLARAFADDPDAPASDFAWVTSSLGTPLVDLEDREAVRRALEGS